MKGQTMTSSALVVLSGGQDSSTCLLWAKREYEHVHAITFDYGQRHRVEIEAAIRVATIVGVESHTIIDIAGLLKSTSPLVALDNTLETYTDYESMDRIIGNRIELTFVPLRNPMFLLVAGNHALSLDTYTLVTGVCALDNANYADCTPRFIASMQNMMREALGMHREDYRGPLMTIVTPLLYLTKAETVRLSMQYPEYNDVLAASHTCYAGVTQACGKCHACVLRAEGFRQAGVPDPLIGG